MDQFEKHKFYSDLLLNWWNGDVGGNYYNFSNVKDRNQNKEFRESYNNFLIKRFQETAKVLMDTDYVLDKNS